ncbi:hypothetical protein M5J20_01200 [Corynebacterium sp. TA-R-1]|uniref:YtxH domain-containing protein n=1 Tax=Corynebacterium stercoris TaxID=2943490 RepID=A0ABT1FYH8_9CORY|nr:hypothetical protein [Corynebacterium stercoris]MCP1386817.1 hypothetical protein [Corynebacterium stercoris]
MIQFVAGAAAGYVLGTKAGRKRYHQIVNATQNVINSPVTKQVTNSARKAIANKIDPEPRLREVKDVSSRRSLRGSKRKRDAHTTEDQIFEPDES